jgi:protein SCO1/2
VTSQIRTLLLLNAAALLIVSCTDSPAPRRFPLAGVVIGVNPTDQTVNLAHDAIEDFMPAMAMSFAVKGTMPEALSPDDRVTATLVVTATESWLEALVVTEPASASSVRPPSLVARIEGATVPDVRLRSHDDRPFTFQSLLGKVVIITFIYTRCPLPDYCPRMMTQVAEVKRALETTPPVAARTRLVALTLDPTFDTPAVLEAYGRRFVDEFDRDPLLVLATGAPVEVQAVSGFFGVKYLESSGQLNHSLSTAVVGTDGRVVKWFPGNAWTPGEVVAVVTDEATRTRD